MVQGKKKNTLRAISYFPSLGSSYFNSIIQFCLGAVAEDLAGSTCFASCELGTASVENKVKYVCSAEEFVELSFYQFLIQCV